MTTKKAIELIKKDIEYYKRQIIWIGGFSDRFAKKFPSVDDSPLSTVKSMVTSVVNEMSGLISTEYKTQIDYYQDILKELEPKKKQHH